MPEEEIVRRRAPLRAGRPRNRLIRLDGSTPNSLRHRLLRADAFDDGIRAHALGQVLDTRDTFFAALGDDVGRAELAREFLAGLVAAHRHDAFRTHLLRGEHAEQTDGAVTDHGNGRAGLHVRGVCRKPAGAHHVRQRQQAWNEVGGRHLASRDQRPVGERHAQQRRLRATDERPMLTRRLIAG